MNVESISVLTDQELNKLLFQYNKSKKLTTCPDYCSDYGSQFSLSLQEHMDYFEEYYQFMKRAVDCKATPREGAEILLRCLRKLKR